MAIIGPTVYHLTAFKVYRYFWKNISYGHYEMANVGRGLLYKKKHKTIEFNIVERRW